MGWSANGFCSPGRGGHGNLVFDPNAPNWDFNVASIQMSEWAILEGL